MVKASIHQPFVVDLSYTEESQDNLNFDKYFTVSSPKEKEQFNIFNEDELNQIPDEDKMQKKLKSENTLNELLEESESQGKDLEKLDIYLNNLGKKMKPKISACSPSEK